MFALPNTPQKILVTAALALALSACGGGGGGGGTNTNNSGSSNSGGSAGASASGAGSATPESLYNGVKTAAVINENSALAAANLPISSLDLILIASLFVTDLPSFDQVVEGTETIQGEGGGSADVSVSSESGKITVTIAFNGFNSSGLTFDGEVVQVSDAPNNYANTSTPYFTLDGSIDYKNAQLQTDSTTLQLNGSISSDQNNGTDLTIDLIAENLTDGSELYLDDFSVSFEHAPRSNSFYGDLGDTITLEGNLYDSSLGLVDISTEQPLRSYSFSEEDNIFAGGGLSEIVVSGEQNAVKFVGLNRNFASIILQDSDPDVGQKMQRVTWSEIYNESEVESLENMSAPIANLGSSFYTAVGTPTKIHGLFSHDDDRNFLDFQWRVVSAPAESNIADEIDLTQPILSFTPDLAGEYLFNLVVSDGIFSSKVSAKVSVEEDDFAPELAEPTAGALEVTLAQDGTNNFTLSANSSAVNSSENLYEDATWYTDELYTVPESVIDGSTAIVTADPEVSWRILTRLNAATTTELSFIANASVPDISVAIPLAKPEGSNGYVERSITKDINGDGDLDLLQVIEGEVLVYLATEDGYEFSQSVPTRDDIYQFTSNTYIEVGDVSIDN